ncbi:hypothetical protein FEM48_Zijuj09G0078600 [Ziziphus jujuba var. spinosa]|uniref:UBA domain-containing protein n=1 Tax=Ziziphus jujuba var. spinosa TaxID=714518 RepID=A0A978URR7_ZIZJJ|nr:hypothetical protein FEM48_Zijuj09G0078600 [Ziziphus jujuba var. spinosa]
MAVPKVNQNFLAELESMGFPLATAIRGLHHSGNDSVEAAVNWIIEHENDPDIDQMPLVTVDIDIKSDEPFPITEEMKIKAQELSLPNMFTVIKVIAERIRAGKELLEAKRVAEENERKRILALGKKEREEEQRAREKIRWKLEQDKLERGSRLGLPSKNPAPGRLSTHLLPEIKNSLPVKTVTMAELMRECLRSLKRNHKDDDGKVRRAFQTLLIYLGNVARNPNEEKYRKIRLSNPLFQERVGSLKGGVEFLELCGFERSEGGEFLYLPHDKVDMAVLNSAGSELKSAINNPFFGLLQC